MSCQLNFIGDVPSSWRTARGWLNRLVTTLQDELYVNDDIIAVDAAYPINPTSLSALWTDCAEPPEGALVMRLVTPVPEFLYYNGTTWLYLERKNYTAAVPPSVNDDANDGYVAGSRWLDVVANMEYVCLHNTVGAAVWVATTLAPGAGTGTVTSVAVAVPAEFSVSGSPLTTFGTITISKVNQSANLIYAGPSAGGAATPTFRLLHADDIPFIDTAKINSGLLVHERGGLEADVSLYNGFVRISGGVTSQIRSIFNSGSNPTVTDDASTGYVVGSRWININTDEEWVLLDSTNGAAVWKITTSSPVGGTVTSVALAMPAIFGVSGSPVTTTGTFTVSLNNQNANFIFAGPTIGAAAAPTFRALVTADIPWATPGYLGATTPAGIDGTFLRIQNTGITLAQIGSDGRFQASRGLGVTNLFIGNNAGSNVDTGFQRNIGIGDSALRGSAATVDTSSNDNTAIGYQAGMDIQTGTTSTLIGSFAGTNLRGGTGHVAIGYEAMFTLTNNHEVVAVGGGAYRLGTASRAIAIGFTALGITTVTGTDNIGIGHTVGGALTSGARNILIGTDTAITLSTGSNNVFIGYNAQLNSLTQRDYAVIIGAGAVIDQSNAMALGGTNTTTFTDIGSGTATPEAKLHLIRHNALTNARHTIAILDSESTAGGSTAAGYGSQILFRGNTTNTASRTLGQIGFQWFDPADANRRSELAVDVNRLGTVVVSGLTFGAGYSSTNTRLRVTGATGDITTEVSINAASGTTRAVFYATAAVSRWAAYVDSTAESGANAGSNYAVARFDDAGAVIDNAYTINRATGLFTITNAFRANGNIGFGVAPVAKPTYGTPTGTLTRTTFATGTVTLVQLAERVAAIIADLEAVGLFL